MFGRQRIAAESVWISGMPGTGNCRYACTQLFQRQEKEKISAEIDELIIQFTIQTEEN